ncbi:hypothetical protein C8R43DRAFT_602053 [Mycena crocata]|nr:hypothetical protein C8R43DRAFT_602053 [Mycena crocata]
MHVLDLPPEILLEIFNQALSSRPFAPGGTTVTILISQVCSGWRTITSDSAALWRDLRISSGSSLPKLAELLHRSRGLLVSVTIDCRAAHAPLAHHWELLTGVMERRARIAALAVIAPIHVLSMLSRIIIRVGTHFPYLRHLNIAQEFAPNIVGLNDNQEMIHTVPFWKSALDARHLKSLSIAGVTPVDHQKANQLECLQVKDSGYFVHPELWIENTSMGAPMAHFAELKVLSIASSPLPLLPACPASTRIVSLTLSGLRTADIPPGTLARFLSALRMPALQHLKISGLLGYLWDEFICWLPDAEYPALHSVAFEGLELRGMDEGCLQAFASVSALRLVDMDAGPIVRMLEFNPGLCPRVWAVDFTAGGIRQIHVRVHLKEIEPASVYRRLYFLSVDYLCCL